MNQQSGIVGELGLVNVRAVGQMGTVVDVPFIANVTEPVDERESLFGEFGVGRVVEVTGKAGPDVEVASVRDSWRSTVLVTTRLISPRGAAALRSTGMRWGNQAGAKSRITTYC